MCFVGRMVNRKIKIHESTDEEAKKGGTENDSEQIDSSGDDESEEDIVLPEFRLRA